VKTFINITCVTAIIALLALPHIDITIPIDGGSGSPITEAFAKSLATDFGEIANLVDEKSPNEIDKAIENAFQRAADESDRELDKSIQIIADDDYEGLKDALLKASEGLR